MRSEQQALKVPLNTEGLPVGFGFDHLNAEHQALTQGEWFHSLDWVEPAEESGEGRRFSGLLAAPSSSRTTKAKATERPISRSLSNRCIPYLKTLP